MKKYILFYSLLFAIPFMIMLVSCEDDTVEKIIPNIEINQSEYEVEYTSGEITVDLTSNVIYYVTIDDQAKEWLSYEFQDNCQTFIIKYDESDTVAVRSGFITLSKSDVEVPITITQAGNPNADNGKLKSMDLEYFIDSSSGYTILSISADECDKIPIGATVKFECGAGGTISFIDGSYSEFIGGKPVDGIFSFVWTQAIADKTAASGLTGILRDGFSISTASAIYSMSNIEYSIDSSSGYTILSVSADVCNNIPSGATVVFECASDEGTISLLDGSYTEFAGGAPVNGKLSFKWTQNIMDITAENGITTGIIRNNFDLSNMYYSYVDSELEYSVTTSGGYTIMSLPVEECANIPIGATVVIECSSDAGTISMLDSSYAQYAGGSPVNGEFSFVWTQEIATNNASSGITTAILRDGFDIVGMYCHN